MSLEQLDNASFKTALNIDDSKSKRYHCTQWFQSIHKRAITII
jgi:hypothetical protein